MTTLMTVNSTGQLEAVIDSVNHVLVRPVLNSTMDDWMDSYINSDNNPHIYTLILQSIVAQIY